MAFNSSDFAIIAFPVLELSVKIRENYDFNV